MKYRVVPKASASCYFVIEKWVESHFLWIFDTSGWQYEAIAMTEQEAKKMIAHLEKPTVYIADTE